MKVKMKFINRTKELNKLNQLWNQKKSQLVVIHGKRRVGKTELIKQFLKEEKGIYYLADKRAHKDQLLEFARVIGNFFEDEFIERKGFQDWLEAFQYLKQKSKKRKFAVVIDEYPYLVQADSATSSIFQKIWDEYIKDSQIYLILCGSSMAMMESELLSYKAPLYGRLTAQLLIEPMTYAASQEFFPTKSFNEFMKYYTVTGGMPAYLRQFANYQEVENAVEDLFWDRQGLYHDEVNIALKQELRRPNIYFAILKAISEGCTRVGKIANHIGENSQLVNKYLETLIRLQFVKREVPITEDKPHKSRKGIYLLTENFVRFWFQYVYSFKSDLEVGNYTEVKEKFENEFNLLESSVYEDVARDHMRKNFDELVNFSRVGRYWDAGIEIDGLGFAKDFGKVIFMEAKWSDTKVRDTELTKLYSKSEKLDKFKNSEKFYVIYSKSGFSKELLKRSSESKNLFLVKGVELLEN